MFPHLPIQMCHFHMQQIIVRHLRSAPKHPAKKDLQELMQTLGDDPQAFIDRFHVLMDRHGMLLKEKTSDGKYRNKKLRSAYQSLKKHLSRLFIYTEISGANIPNTTNHLDGLFSHVKKYLALHQGLNEKNRKKAAIYLLKHWHER